MNLPCIRAHATAPLAAVASALAGIVLVAWAFHPGYMSYDSFLQLQEGRSGSYLGWHPPVMSWVWGRVDRVVPGPFGMLIFHNAMFWGGLAALATVSAARAPKAALCVFWVGLFPSSFALLGTVWKDVGFAAAFVGGLGSLAFCIWRGSRLLFVLSLASFLYGSSVRHNSILAFAPISIFCAIAVRRLFPMARRLPLLVLAPVPLVALFTLSAVISGGLRSGPPVCMRQAFMLHDLTAIALGTEVVRFPSYAVAGDPTIAQLSEHYTPICVDTLIADGERPASLKLARTEEHCAQLTAVWRDLVPRHFGTYLEHRWKVFLHLLAIGPDELYYPFQNGTDANPLGITVSSSAFNRWVAGTLRSVQNSVLFRPWFHLGWTLIWVAIAFKNGAPNRWTILLLASSAWIYMLGYFPTAPSTDFRYGWWAACVALLLPVALFSEREWFPGVPPDEVRPRAGSS